MIDALGQSHTLTYDADGNLAQVDSGGTSSYTYNALNQRVSTANAGQDTMEYFFNPEGQRVAIWDVTNHWQDKGNSYWGSLPIEFYYDHTAHFQHQNGLGTERMATDYTGNIEGTFTSLPFGDGYTVNGADYDTNHFGMLDHDLGLPSDHAQFRQYYATPGAWMSPDPYSGSYDFSNPQSMNRYSYVMNNPLSSTDPTGQMTCSGCDPIKFACPWCGAVVEGADLIYDLGKVFCWWGCRSSFHGSLKPRPNGQPWDEYHIHYGPNIAGALGLPDIGCEFGACSGGPMDWTSGQQTSTSAASSSDMEYDIFHCPSCANTWRQSNMVVKGASVATVAAVSAVPLAGEAATSAAGDFLFARGAGLLNANNVLRIGWGWYGAHIIDNLPTGGEVFRVVVGCPSCIIHWHIWPF